MKVNKELIFKVASIGACVIAAAGAFFTEADKQLTDRTIKDLANRVSKLENK